MNRIASVGLGVFALWIGGCGPAAGPASQAVPVEGGGALVQEEWPDEVKQAEAQFQQSAEKKAQAQGQ